MKNKTIRFIALILIFSFVFALSACKGDKNKPTELSTAPTTEDIMSRPLSVELIKVALGSAENSNWDGNYASLTAEQKQTIMDFFAEADKPVEFRGDNIYFIQNGVTAAPTEETTVPVETTTEPGNTTTTTTKPGTTTTKPSTTTTKPGNTTTTIPATTTTTTPSITSATTTTTTPATTTPATEAETDPLVITSAPVGETAEQVIKYYNNYGNNIKAYKGKVTVTKKDGTTSKIQSIDPASLKMTAESVLPNDYKEKITYTFVNGTSTKDNKSLSNWLPRNGSAKLSELSPTGENGVNSAVCTKSGNGYKVVIVMSDDKTSGTTAISDKPKYVSKCMDAPSPSATSYTLPPLDKGDVYYTGCTIEAIFDEYGRMTKLDIITPARIVGSLTYKVLGVENKIENIDMIATYKGNYTFTY